MASLFRRCATFSSSRVALAASVLSVTRPQGEVPDPKAPRPAHHANDSQSAFINPWPSARTPTILDVFGALKALILNSPTIPEDIETQVRARKPTWGKEADPRKAKATWLGHACFLLELPAPPGAFRGARILFDPVFSHRCSPFSFVGPARHTKPPCTISEIPDIDCIVISHNHYDHMDETTLKELELLHKPHIFAPLGNAAWFGSLGVPTERTHIMDWWEVRNVLVGLPANDRTIETNFAVTCTPAQHFTGRGVFDRFKTLWASWAVEDHGNGSEKGFKAWFGGDTGYRTVLDGEDEDESLVCPEFKRIGENFGGFDLAFIPIGAYLPRNLMSTVHCAPQDSVRVFKDIRAKRALGMHWGTWILTTEPLMEPPKKLAEECEKLKIEKGVFDVCGLGETVLV